MTREEQISQANPYDNGNPYWDEDNDIIGARDLAAHCAFEEGVIWADANPNWHIEPPTIEENKFCSSYKLIYLNDGSFEMAYYNRRGEWVISAFDTLDKTMGQEVIAWTELPEPPKFY